METIERASNASGLRRYLDIYATLWKNSVVREMQFKTNFILWIIVEFLWFGLQLSFIAVIYRHTDHIGDWSKWEVMFLIGTSQLVQQIFGAIFFTNLSQLSESIRTGKLDFMLLLPINTRFIISFRQVDLGGFINGAGAVALMTYAGHQLHLSPTLSQIAGFLMLVVASIGVHYALLLVLAASSFWTVRAQGIVWGYYNLFNLARLPDAAFKGYFRVIFTFVLPMLLVANVPTKLLINKLGSSWEMGLLLCVSLFLLICSEGVWRFALKHYTSASS